MKRSVYNFEFPPYCDEINIFGYNFIRVEDYEEKVINLPHLKSSFSEVPVRIKPGTHEITAYVEFPDQEEQSVLEWSGVKLTALNDILLLLSIFMGRNVFISASESDRVDYDTIITDPRVYSGGSILRTSIPFRGQPIDQEPFKYDIGFQEGLNNIYSLIRTKEWQNEYKRGYFLFLARTAFHPQPLEAIFIQCWTIWEHLFSILNQNWLSDREIHALAASDKISFLLVKYALRKDISKSEHKRINDLAEIRNRLIHFGRFPVKGSFYDDAVLFARLTEFVIAKILNLPPSNIFNTLEQLEKYLNETDKK